MSEPRPILDDRGRVDPGFDANVSLSGLTGNPFEYWAVQKVLLNHQVASPDDRVWQFLPFRRAAPETLELALADDNGAVALHESDPFDPHAIAALRIGAYERATLVQYVDNLIEWGDSLFSEDTMESVASATMLYVYAYDLLGRRPENLGRRPSGDPLTFEQIAAAHRTRGGGIPAFMVELENRLAPTTDEAAGDDDAGASFSELTAHFRLPENDQLLRRWDTLDDRLHKIRSSMNIEGEVRQLALFSPELDPMELVRAAAASPGSIGALEHGAAELPPYRFTTMIDRAKAITAQVTELGSKLLAALQGKDAEQLQALHATHEGQMLTLLTTMKQRDVEEQTASVAGLQVSLAAQQNRVAHYRGLISAGLNAGEATHLGASAAALVFKAIAAELRVAGAIGYAVPQVGSPFAMTYGGEQIGAQLTGDAGAVEVGADISDWVAQTALTMAGYERRAQDWQLAMDDAQSEADVLQQQIAAAQARLAAARHELDVHQREIDQNAEVQAYLAAKFSNADLYQWMASRISAVYFQAYRLALDLALRAQTAYRYELGGDDVFVTLQYWDGLKHGLMAGENLAFSLAQMESSYLAKHTRRLEIERTVSLALSNPQALWDLKRDGRCAFSLTEELFDYDYPGHYNRQIKSVSLSIPAVLGPYENVKATLRQTYSAVVTDPAPGAVERLLDRGRSGASQDAAGDVPGLVEDRPGSARQVAISHGVDDSGMFVLDFRDERYLPFEGTGAVSDWSLSMPRQTNRFDFDAISDVIVTVRYTAQDGGDAFAEEVTGKLGSRPLPGAVYLSLAQGHSAEWAAFLEDRSHPGKQELAFRVEPRGLEHFSRTVLTGVGVKLTAADGVEVADGADFVAVAAGAAEPRPVTLQGGVGELAPASSERDVGGDWKVVVDLGGARDAAPGLLGDDGRIDPAKLLNLELVLRYDGSVDWPAPAGGSG